MAILTYRCKDTTEEELECLQKLKSKLQTKCLTFDFQGYKVERQVYKTCVFLNSPYILRAWHEEYLKKPDSEFRYKPVIKLPVCDEEVLDCLLDFCITKKLEMRQEKLGLLVEMANLLEMHVVVNAALQFVVAVLEREDCPMQDLWQALQIANKCSRKNKIAARVVQLACQRLARELQQDSKSRKKHFFVECVSEGGFKLSIEQFFKTFTKITGMSKESHNATKANADSEATSSDSETISGEQEAEKEAEVEIEDRFYQKEEQQATKSVDTSDDSSCVSSDLDSSSDVDNNEEEGTKTTDNI